MRARASTHRGELVRFNGAAVSRLLGMSADPEYRTALLALFRPEDPAHLVMSQSQQRQNGWPAGSR